MRVKVGTAPDSWGVWFANDPKQTPWQRCFDEIVEAGYEITELGPYGYLPTELETVRREMVRRGLKVTANAVEHTLENPDWPALERELTGSGELLAGLGAEYIVLIDNTYTEMATGKRMQPSTLNDEEWKRLIETTHRSAELVESRFRLRLVFHPHAETHVETEEQIERFLRDTDPKKVALCLDTGHHAYRGGDPVRFMREHHKRIPYLHLKSIDREIQRRVAEERIPFAQAVGMDMFCEPSRGGVDFIALRDLLQELDYEGYGIVEQDMYPAPFDKPLPIAKRTREYLREIGMG